MSEPPSTGRDHIFISYRRDDARGASGRLYDWLRIGFGREHVFRDVASIGVGKWREKIDRALAQSAVCVAVIGPRWANQENLPRLKNVGDLVRHELVAALATPELIVVPTLVEGAKLPKATELPRPLRPLLTWNAFDVTEKGWEDDTRRLIGAIADEASLRARPDLDTLLRDVGAAQDRIAELEQTRHLQAGQIEGLRHTVDQLTRKLAEASAEERPGLAAAFAALARGDSRAAEDAFEREVEAQSRAAEEARLVMAEAARNVANLALLRDVAKAVAFYRKALAVEPNDAKTAYLLGQALILIGDLHEAAAAFDQSLRAAITAHDYWSEMTARTGLGDVSLATGALSAAHAAYGTAQRLAEQLLARDPANTVLQRNLAVSHIMIGNVLVAQGDGLGALAAFRTALAIAEALAGCDPANAEWQRDLSVSHDRIGGVLVAQGDGPGALVAFRTGLAIREALAASDPANAEWQRDLFVSHERIGNLLVLQGDGPGALVAFRTALAIAEALAARDPANTRWQRDLSLSHHQIGNALVAQGDGPGALAAFRKALPIREVLAARDPANAQWQRDFSISHNRIGAVLVAQGDGPGALAAFRKAMAVAEALAARDPANAEWQRDLIVALVKLGDVTGDRAYAGKALNVALGMQQRGVLAPRDAWMIEALRQRSG